MARFQMNAKKIIYILLIMIAVTINLIFLVNAEESFEFKQGENFTLEMAMALADLSSCDTCTCEVSIFYPDGTTLIKNAAGTNVDGYCHYNSSSDNIGTHGVDIAFNNGVDYGRATYEIEITPSGFTGTLGFYIIVMLLAFGLMMFGFYAEDSIIILFGSVGLFLIGIFIITDGIAGFRDSLVTVGIGYITLGIASYTGFRASYELYKDM